jgi:hypothetical protein
VNFFERIEWPIGGAGGSFSWQVGKLCSGLCSELLVAWPVKGRSV